MERTHPAYPGQLEVKHKANLTDTFINYTQSELLFNDNHPPRSFTKFLHKHSSPSLASFNDRVLSYSAVFLLTYTAFLVQAAVLFPTDTVNGVRLALLGAFILTQICLTVVVVVEPRCLSYISSSMLTLTFLSAAVVVVLDKDFSETFSDSSLEFSQLPPYLPVLVLSSCCPLFIVFEPWVFLVSNSGVLGLYLVTHLFTASTVLTVCLETLVVAVYVVSTWRRTHSQFKQLQSTYSLVKSLEEASEDSPSRLKTGLEQVLNSLKRVKQCLELMMPLQSEEVRAVTQQLVLSLFEVHQRIAETDLNSADALRLAEIDPDDQEFIQQNYMQVNATPKEEPKTPAFKLMMQASHVDRYEYKDLVSVLSQMGKTWNFNTFMLANLTDSQPLAAAGKHSLIRYGLVERFLIPEEKYMALFNGIEQRYKPNPYHNSSHAVDVMHSFMYLALHSELNTYFNSLEILGCLLASLAHDLGHPGVTNRFLVGSKDSLALKYNDYSVLEMMHSSLLFELMCEEDKSILENVSEADWSLLRRQVIEMILSTDMSRHFELLGKFRAFQADLSLEALAKFEVRLEVYKMTLKCADVGHAAKSHELHERWTSLICEEFFNQGDVERAQGMQISMYCDRHNTDLPKSQFGFIKNLIIPLFEGLNSYLKSSKISKHCIQQLNDNLVMWKDKQPVKTSKIILGNQIDDLMGNRKQTDFRRSMTSVRSSKSP
jgi:hypothetical protein